MAYKLKNKIELNLTRAYTGRQIYDALSSLVDKVDPALTAACTRYLSFFGSQNLVTIQFGPNFVLNSALELDGNMLFDIDGSFKSINMGYIHFPQHPAYTNQSTGLSVEEEQKFFNNIKSGLERALNGSKQDIL